MIDWEWFAICKNMTVEQLMTNSYYNPKLKEEMLKYEEEQQRKDNKENGNNIYNQKKR